MHSIEPCLVQVEKTLQGKAGKRKGTVALVDVTLANHFDIYPPCKWESVDNDDLLTGTALTTLDEFVEKKIPGMCGMMMMR